MGNEDAVYLAKLAEQAERYEGTSFQRLYRADSARHAMMLTPCVHLQRWSRT